jgi:hypothetical protein
MVLAQRPSTITRSKGSVPDLQSNTRPCQFSLDIGCMEMVFT